MEVLTPGGPQWIENNFNNRQIAESDVWHKMVVYGGADGSALVIVHKYEIDEDIAEARQASDIETPIEEFFDDLTLLAHADEVGFGNIHEHLGYTSFIESSDDLDTVHVAVGTPGQDAINEKLDEVRIKTGYAPRIEIYPEMYIPVEDITDGLGQDVIYVSADPRMRAHDMVTHASILALLPESTLGRASIRGKRVAEEKANSPFDEQAAQTYDTHFTNYEYLMRLSTLATALNWAQKDRELGIDFLSECLLAVCEFSEGPESIYESRREAEAVLDRIELIKQVLSQQRSAA